MSQIEDLRKGQSDHEDRISRLESLVNPFAKELQEGAAAKAVENLLDDEPVVPSDPPADLPPPQPSTAPPETNPEGAMGIVVGGNGQQPSVSEGSEEPKDEAN